MFYFLLIRHGTQIYLFGKCAAQISVQPYGIGSVYVQQWLVTESLLNKKIASWYCH